MSQKNVELLRRGFEHVERTREIPPELAHPDFVWDTTTFRGGMQPATCVGVEEANRWIAEWAEGFEDWSLEVTEVVEAGDHVITVVNQRGRAKHGGPEVEMRIAQLWTFRDGLIARMEMYSDRAGAVRAVGLAPDDRSAPDL